MLQVFRIEHTETCVGPFQTNDEFTQELAVKAASRPTLKLPGDDGLPLGHLPYCFVFGCRDFETLKDWFFLGNNNAENEHIVRTLKQKGFQLAEFLVEEEDYWMSDSGVQLAFHAGHCRDEGLVQYHDLDALLFQSMAPVQAA